MKRNKIEYGISNLHVGEYIEEDGTVILGKAIKVPGAISLTLDEKSDEVKVHADNVTYYSRYNESGEAGDLNVTTFDDRFKEKFLGYKILEDGGLAKIKGSKKPSAYIIFQAEGDEFNRRFIMYNVAFGSIKRDHKTVDDKIDADTEKIAISITGDNETGIVKAAYNEESEVYNTIFEKPPSPKKPVEIENTLTTSSPVTFSKRTAADVDIKVSSTAQNNEVVAVKLAGKLLDFEKTELKGLNLKISKDYLKNLDVDSYDIILMLEKGKEVKLILKITE